MINKTSFFGQGEAEHGGFTGTQRECIIVFSLYDKNETQ